MNIWAWVHETKRRLRQGDPQAERLAELIDDLPSAVVDEAHERVDGMVPEALALCRELDEPWVEVFIRHWNLQSRVLHRRRAGDELREAVALLDFANGSQTTGCPQAVCSVQDLAVCYAIRDGPGFVPERLAVARETLDRIDPGWACFDCITGEYFSALLDDERAAEGLAFIDAQIVVAAEHGELEIGFNTRLNRARALLALGRAQEALDELDRVHDLAENGRSRMMTHRQARAAAMIGLGRFEDALELHPPLSAVLGTGGHLRDWLDNLVGLVDAETIPNTARIGRELLEISTRFFEHQALWDAARTSLISARLAAARGARETTRMLLDDAARASAQLRRPQLLAPLRAEVEQALARLGPPPSEPSDDPEQQLDRLAHAQATGTLDADDTLELASALRAVGRASKARALLEQHTRTTTDADADGGDGRLLLELAASMLAEHDHAALDELVAAHGDGPLQLRWIHGQSLFERGELEALVALDRESLERAPSIVPFAMRLAAGARKLGDWATALMALEHASELVEPGNVDWDRITAATVLGRWASVRAAAERLELELPPHDPNAPIDVDLGFVRCEFVEPNGQRERFWARRSSPCGARIIEIAMPGTPQHFGDEVVFEPADLDAHERQGNEHHRPCFEVVAITKPGDYQAFLLRGFDPGRERFELLRQQVEDAGYGFERITREGRTAPDPREQGADVSIEVPTVALLIASPRTRDPQQLRSLLADACADWELPLLSPTLDEAAGDEAAAAASREQLDRWDP